MIPSTTILPLRESQIEAGGKELVLYMRDLVEELQSNYEDVVENVNGSLQMFTAKVSGTTMVGSGTYVTQDGWYLRQGIIVDVWFDIEWSAHTGTGNLYVELPYTASRSLGTPWVGVVQTDSVTYATGTSPTILAIPDTLRGEIWTSGSGIADANVAIAGTGHIIGHIRYVGQDGK